MIYQLIFLFRIGWSPGFSIVLLHRVAAVPCEFHQVDKGAAYAGRLERPGRAVVDERTQVCSSRSSTRTGSSDGGRFTHPGRQPHVISNSFCSCPCELSPLLQSCPQSSIVVRLSNAVSRAVFTSTTKTLSIAPGMLTSACRENGRDPLLCIVTKDANLAVDILLLKTPFRRL